MAKTKKVLAAFLKSAARRLGMTLPDMGEKIGRSGASLYAYIRDGKCPVAVRAAVNGLLAEALQLPAVIESETIRARPAGEMRVLSVQLPKDQLRVARAMFASLGWTYIEEN